MASYGSGFHLTRKGLQNLICATVTADCPGGGGGGGTPSNPLNSVQFNDAGSFGGSTQLTYDDSVGVHQLSTYRVLANDAIGIGQAPGLDYGLAPLLKISSDLAVGHIDARQHNNSQDGGDFWFFKTRGTHAAPLPCVGQDRLGFFRWGGLTEGTTARSEYGQIYCKVDEETGQVLHAPSSPGAWLISTSPTGSSLPIARLAIAQNGNVVVGPGTGAGVATSPLSQSVRAALQVATHPGDPAIYANGSTSALIVRGNSFFGDDRVSDTFRAGGMRHHVTGTKRADYVITANDYIVFGSSSAAPMSLILPSAADLSVQNNESDMQQGTGKMYILKNVSTTNFGASTLTVNTDNVSELIDNEATADLSIPNSSITVVASGSNWYIV